MHVLSTVLVLAGLGYLGLTMVLSRKKRPVDADGPEPQLFVFVVPALDEELVIESTVRSLLGACADRGVVAVVDDGSTDRTSEVLGSIADERLVVVARRPPDARRGKGAALNDAYRRVRRHVLNVGIDPRSVVLCIVDADGRLEPDVLHTVGRYFRDPGVGAVQLLVRIRNRARWLCRFQDYEFLVFSSLTQTAREKLGSVGLGGNGQFTRLAALMELGDDPWSECLTEDLDLGVRLAIAGWQNRFAGETFVDQQGLASIPKLVRQRTRWAHGHFQCWRLIPDIVRSPLPTVTVLDMCYYLIAPAFVLVQALVFTAGWAWLAYGIVAHPEAWRSGDALIFGATVYALSLGPALYLSFLYWRRSGDVSAPSAFAMAHVLVLYNYLWYVAECRAVCRILRRRTGWAKTARTAEPAPAIRTLEPA